VPIRVNAPTRASRLVKSIPSYVRRSIGTMLRIFITYRPLRFFALLSLLCVLPGVGIGVRFLYYYVLGRGQGMIQSLLLAALLLGDSMLLLVVGPLADVIAANRKLLERSNLELKDISDRLRNLEKYLS
jgi:hypothetical protein